MISTRSKDPYPFTWEIPLLILVLVVTVLALGVHVARGAANLVTGHGWAWPTGTDQMVTSLPAVLTGDATAGLAPGTTGASPALLWVSLVVVQLALWLAVLLAGTYCYTRWGPGRTRGMATRAEAEQMLGVSRLRRNRALIRPDLYGKQGTRR